MFSLRRIVRGRLPTSRQVRLEILLGIASLVAGLFLLNSRFPESWWTDRRFVSSPKPFAPEAMLVGIDEKYSENHQEGGISPAYLAQILSALAELKPTAVAVDFRFGVSEMSYPGADSLLAALRKLRTNGVSTIFPTWTAEWAGRNEIARVPVTDAPHLTGISGWRVPSQTNSTPVLIRSFPPAEQLSNGCWVMSLPLVSVAAHHKLVELQSTHPCGAHGIVSRNTLDNILERFSISNPTKQISIHFSGPLHTTKKLHYYSSEDLIKDISRGISLETYSGKLVLVASLMPDPTGVDQIHTPFGIERGGALHYYAIDTLLNGRTVSSVSHKLGLGIALAIFLFSACVWKWLPGWLAPLIADAVSWIVYVVGTFEVYNQSNLLLPISTPLWAGFVGAIVGFLFLHPRILGSESVRKYTPDTTEPPSPECISQADNAQDISERSVQAINLIVYTVGLGWIFFRAFTNRLRK